MPLKHFRPLPPERDSLDSFCWQLDPLPRGLARLSEVAAPKWANLSTGSTYSSSEELEVSSIE